MLESTLNILSDKTVREACGLCRGDWLAHAAVGVFVIDAEHILYVNPHLAKLFGYAQGDFGGALQPCDLLVEAFRPAARQVIARCLRGESVGGPQVFEGLRADGGRVYIEAVGTRTAFRGAPAIIGLVMDHSERRRAETALLGQLDFTSQLIEAIPAPVFYKDAKGRYLGCNHAFEAYIGHTRQELIGKTVYDISPKDLADAYAAADRRLLGHPGTQTYEADVAAGDGTRRCVVFNKATFSNPDAQIGGLVGVILDVTERRRAEQQLFESQERLRSLTARIESVREDERTRISREIHDELGQTLTGLKMDMSWLRGQLRSDQPALAEKLNQMSALVDVTVQTVRKISWELRPEPLDSLGLVAAIDWQARDFQVRNGIRCKVKLPSAHLEIDEAVASSLFRILQELLTNVTRHAAASSVDVQLQADDRQAVLVVRDNGKGMPGSAEAGAHSLGLLGVRERARHLGGSVEIVSIPRIKGTKVTVTIPLPWNGHRVAVE